ncbi:hypothetical protein [Rodentibacter caecimuris]|uniref:hypothetical protein n=1 Tax=Rodentibacter caecimuris TaxID=1796644 RepID=UPI002FF4B29D
MPHKSPALLLSEHTTPSKFDIAKDCQCEDSLFALPLKDIPYQIEIERMLSVV